MDWLERLKKRKPFLVCTWAVAGLLALGGIAGAINSLIDLYERGFDSAGGWYAIATGWLSSEMTIPVWLGLLSTVLLIILAVSAAIYLFRYLKADSESDSLADHQEIVLAAISYCTHHLSILPTMQNLIDSTGLGALKTEGGLDALLAKGFVDWYYDINESTGARSRCLALTPSGRSYLLRNEIAH